MTVISGKSTFNLPYGPRTAAFIVVECKEQASHSKWSLTTTSEETVSQAWTGLLIQVHRVAFSLDRHYHCCCDRATVCSTHSNQRSQCSSGSSRRWRTTTGWRPSRGWYPTRPTPSPSWPTPPSALAPCRTPSRSSPRREVSLHCLIRSNYALWSSPPTACGPFDQACSKFITMTWTCMLTYWFEVQFGWSKSLGCGKSCEFWKVSLMWCVCVCVCVCVSVCVKSWTLHV